MTHRFILSFAAAAAFSLVAGSAHAQDAAAANICIVDLQRGLNEVDEGQEARTRLEGEFERRQGELDTEEQELATWIQELEARIEVMNPEARAAAMQEYQTRMMTLQQQLMEYQESLATAEGEATEQIFERMMAIVGEYAREASCTLVLEKSSVLYASDAQTEFTSELVTRYNARH
ncbi:MAG: outer membrane protein [Flavobacteriales bacterium]|jgi:outer membrane protein